MPHLSLRWSIVTTIVTTKSSTCSQLILQLTASQPCNTCSLLYINNGPCHSVSMYVCCAAFANPVIKNVAHVNQSSRSHWVFGSTLSSFSRPLSRNCLNSWNENKGFNFLHERFNPESLAFMCIPAKRERSANLRVSEADDPPDSPLVRTCPEPVYSVEPLKTRAGSVRCARTGAVLRWPNQVTTSESARPERPSRGVDRWTQTAALSGSMAHTFESREAKFRNWAGWQWFDQMIKWQCQHCAIC